MLLLLEDDDDDKRPFLEFFFCSFLDCDGVEPFDEYCRQSMSTFLLSPLTSLKHDTRCEDNFKASN